MIETACNILTGFLGSGKTTLLRHVLEHGLDGRRVAVVMNEIGDIGLEGRVVEGLGAVEGMVELNSGCVCCTIDEYQFAYGIETLLDELNPDLIIIETTGIADPAPIEQRLRGLRILPDAVIAVVDVAHYLTLEREHDVLARQVAGADFIVQTKTDLADADTARAVEERIRALNDRAILCHARHGVPDNELLFGTSVRTWRAAANAGQEADAHAHEIGAFTYRTDARLDEDALREALDALPPAIYRAKGCFPLTSGEARLFNYVCGRVDFQPLPLGLRVAGQAVFIGKRSELDRESIERRLRECEAPMRVAAPRPPP